MNDPASQFRSIGLEKLLAIAVYGETVTAYRYLVLAERAATEAGRCLFAELADAGQCRKQQLQKVLLERFPGVDSVLTPEDKTLVVSSPRLLDADREFPLAEALELMLRTERKVADFHTHFREAIDDRDLSMLFGRLAEEAERHIQRLQTFERDQ